jgi:glyoxylase-like metal-dependent hydrolase (beta-lactamase superfamily II)
MRGASLRLGDVDVITICEGYAPLPLEDEAPGHTVEWSDERAKYPWAFPDDQNWAWHVHAFLLRTPAGDVLVDTGSGGFGPYAPWADADPAAWSQVESEAVRHVVLTHLHADHAGGGVRDDGAPRFPNARYHVHPADWEHFEASPTFRDADGARYDARTAMTPLFESGAVSLDPDDRDVSAGVRVVHTPGHTPGHRSVVVEDEHAGTLLLTGDLLHVPVQIAHPDWVSSHDEDPAEGAASRVRSLGRARDLGWWLGVSHFARPFGRLVAGGWSAEDWSAED